MAQSSRHDLRTPESMPDRGLALRDRLLMEAVALLFIVAIAVAARYSGWYYLLFPELAAIAHDTFTRPWGKWASQPARLVLTPTLGAVIGTLITREFPYQVISILLIVTLCLLILALLRSNIAPVISAGTLPLVLGVKNWLYPVSIALGLIALVSILLLWRRGYRRRYQSNVEVSTTDAEDLLETPPSGNTWVLPFYFLLTVLASCATVSDLRFILFPPLIVIAYEMFAHATSCPWAGKPLALPVACFLTSTAGWLAVSVFGSGGIAAGCGMLFGIIVLRFLRIHMPPALAVGLLPLLIDSPSAKYPVSVSIGTVALTLAYLVYRRWIVGQGRAGEGVARV
jgi:HPP family